MWPVKLVSLEAGVNTVRPDCSRGSHDGLTARVNHFPVELPHGTKQIGEAARRVRSLEP